MPSLVAALEIRQIVVFGEDRKHIVFQNGPVDVAAPEKIIAPMVNHVNHAFFGFNKSGVESPSTKIVNEPISLSALYLKAVSKRSSNGLLEKRTALETRKLCRLPSCITLMQLKCGGNGDY